MNYKIIFFNDTVYNDIKNLPKDILLDLLDIFEMASRFGGNLGRPYSAPLNDGLFEFRAKGKSGIARSIFINLKDKQIMVLHTIIKKSNKIPKKDLDLALKRAKELR